jgi:hypothetical protein
VLYGVMLVEVDDEDQPPYTVEDYDLVYVSDSLEKAEEGLEEFSENQTEFTYRLVEISFLD